MQCAVLERVELSLTFSSLGHIHRWIYDTLQTTTSTMFNEFAIWILNIEHPWSLQSPFSDAGWETLDALFNVLAERNHDFRVVVKGDLHSFHPGIRDLHDAVRLFIKGLLPLVSSKGLVKFVLVPHRENRFRKSGIL